MSASAHDENLELRAALFKALGSATRLLILNLIRLQPRHGEELAAILSLKPATISHHLGLLASAGLIQARKHQYYQVYSLLSEHLDRPLGELVFVPQPDLRGEVQEDAYRAKVLRAFFRRGRLASIPAQLKKRQIVMQKLVEAFEYERQYSEHQVNQALLEFHEDVAALRRELISQGLMARDHNVYWRLPPAAQAADGS